MREAAARGPSIDITEFERRLRSAEANETPTSPDPLAELARLLHGDEPAPAADDPYKRVFAADERRAETPPPSPPPYPDQFHAGDLRGSLPPSHAVEDYSSYHYPSDRAHEAEWQDHATHGDAQYQAHDYLDYADEPEAYPDYEEEERPKGGFERIKSKVRAWHAVAGVVVIGAISVGWAFAHRSGVVAPSEIVTIKAPEGPAKVHPSTVAETPPPQRGATILDRTESAPPVKKVVSQEEQPVDPSAVARVVKLGDGPVDAPHEPAPAPALEPKKVKTVSVRPDGTIIERDAQPPAIARPAPPASPSRGGLDANPFSIDDGDASSQSATPKGLAKPATTPRIAQPPRPKPDKPAEVAAVEPNAAEPPAAADAAWAPATGGYAVQFGAAGSEAEARQLVQRITGKYGSQIGGNRVGYRLAKVGEKTVYRVRLGGVSKESAVSICEKVKAAGGNCFVAAN
jgi:hypothetical protein